MNRRVRILPRATAQLYESALWWATNRSVAQAARWLAGIEAAIEDLADNASNYPLARESHAIELPIHQCNFGVSTKATHRILYSFDESQVLVYAIRHLSQSDFSQGEIE